MTVLGFQGILDHQILNFCKTVLFDTCSSKPLDQEINTTMVNSFHEYTRDIYIYQYIYSDSKKVTFIQILKK